MTFDQWMKKQQSWYVKGDDSEGLRLLRKAWQDSAINENQRCLKTIEKAANCRCGFPCDCFNAGTAKWAIKVQL